MTNRLSAERNEDFYTNIHENFAISNFLQDLVLISSQIHELFQELIKKYLHVLLAQFRKDVKSASKIEKKMAHRKQIKVSQKVKTKSKKSTGTSDTISHKKQRQSNVVTHETRIEHVLTQSTDTASVSPQPPMSMSRPPFSDIYSDPVPGPSGLQDIQFSGLSDDNQSTEPSPDKLQDDLCKKCLTEKNDDWIQCDSCNAWFHRKCSGLKTKKQWATFSKDGVSWFCFECQ